MSSSPPTTSVHLVAKDAPPAVASVQTTTVPHLHHHHPHGQSQVPFLTKRVTPMASSDEGFFSSTAAIISSSSATSSSSTSFASPYYPKSSRSNASNVSSTPRGGDFKCGVVVDGVGDSASTFDSREQQQGKQQQQQQLQQEVQRRKEPKKSSPKVTILPSTRKCAPNASSATSLSSSSSSSSLQTSSNATRRPCETIELEANFPRQQHHRPQQQQQQQQHHHSPRRGRDVRDYADDDDDGERCHSILPEDLCALRLPDDDESPTNDSGLESRKHSIAEEPIVEEEEKVEVEIDYYRVDRDRDTLLHIAVVENEDAALFLIGKAKSPSELDSHNKCWSSPVHLAARIGNSDSLRDLIVNGANVAERDAKGDTALHIACGRGHYECFQSLTRPFSQEDPVIVDYKPPFQRLPQNLEMVNYEGLTCFHLAALHRRKRIMRELLVCGAEVNSADARSGRTALHFVVEKHDVEVVRYLLEECKADVNSECFDGSTALSLAEGRSFKSLASLLRSYGADPDRGIAASRNQRIMDGESDYGSDEDFFGDC